MPVSRRYPLRDVLPACRDYSRQTGRRLLLEYVLLGGVNTSDSAARALTRIARDLQAFVNLIAFNNVEPCPFQPPRREETARFRSILEGQGVNVTQRYRRGRDIAAGCGQLRGEHAGSRE
jgi:23S rRNA (adenine2503-C2)-methyltransferase